MARIIKYYERGEWKYATVKDIGEISNLMTTNKTDIVSAINELYAQGGAVPPDLEQKIQQLETITQEHTGSIDSIYTDLGVVDGEITAITTQQSSNTQKIQTLTLEAETTQDELNQAKQDLLNKAEKAYVDAELATRVTATELSTELAQKAGVSYVDAELAKKLSESQYQEDYLATQAQIDEKLDLTSYQTDYDAIVADISSKVDVTAFNGVEGRVTSAESSITNINNELEQKVSSLDYESDVGINKWLVTRYTGVLSDMAQYNPEHSMIQNASEQETIELLDGATISPEASNASIYRLFTNVYTSQAKTIGLTLSYQDSIHVLMNGASIYKNKSNAGAGITASLSLRKGWNTVEILLGNKDGQPSINFSTILSDMVDKMTTVIGVGDRNEFRLKQAETSIKQNSDEIALRATKTEVSNLGNRVSDAESELTVQAGQIASKVSQTEFDGYSQRLGEAESTITQQADQIASKVSQTDYNLLNGKVDEHETEILQMSDEIALKASQSSVDALSGEVDDVQSSLTVQAGQIATKVESTTLTTELAKKEGSITKSATAPSNPYTNQMWLDTSGSISILKTWTGTAWKKATPTSAGEVGAYTKSETDSKTATALGDAKTYADGKVAPVLTRLTDAETGITQNQDEIALRATKQEVDVIKTDVGNVVTRVSNAETAIEQNSDEIALRATKTELNGLTGRVSTAESQLTVQAGEIATKVSQTDFDDLDGRVSSAESAITQTQNDINLKASKTEVYTKSETDTKVGTKADQTSLNSTNSNLSSLTTRVTDAEADINVNAEQIALRATKSEFNSLSGRVSTAESQLTVQSGQIASKVSQSDYDSQTMVWEQRHSVNTATPSVLTEKNGSEILPSYAYSYKVEARIPVTGSNTGAIAYFRAGGTTSSPAFTLDKVFEKGTTSNQIEFFLNSDGKPSVRLYGHTSLYEVYITTTKFLGTTSESLEIGERLTSAESSITQNSNQIASKVSQTDFNSLSGRVSNAESSITQQAGQITSKVESTTFNNYKNDSGTADSWRLSAKSFANTGWYRIAMNTGDRAFAKFTIKDTQSGKHSTAIFNSGVHYGNNPTVTLVGFSNYASQAFTKARIVKKSTYDDVYLELYVIAPAILEVWCSDNIQSSGWRPVNYTDGGVPADYTAVEFAINANNVADATSQNTAKDTSYVNGVPSNTLTTDVSNAKSTITQHSSAINLRVEKNKVVSEINQSSESIKISASKIDITGSVTFSDFASNEKELLAGGSGLANYNPYFTDWTGALPYRINTWTGVTPSKYTSKTMNGGNGLRFTCTDAQDGGVNLHSYFKTLPNNEYYTVEIDFMLLSGSSLSGAGLLLDWSGLSPYRKQINLKDEIANPETNKWYTVRKVLKRDAGSGTYSSMGGYLMANWTGAGSRTAKDIVYDRVEVRVSTQQEIDVHNGKSNWDYSLSRVNTWKHPSDSTKINGGEIYTNSITATQINVSNLSALTANLGTVTAGNIQGVSFESPVAEFKDDFGRWWREWVKIGVGGNTFRTTSERTVSVGGGDMLVAETVIDSDGVTTFLVDDDNFATTAVTMNGYGLVFSGTPGTAPFRIYSDYNLDINVPSGNLNFLLGGESRFHKNGEVIRLVGDNHSYISFYNGTTRQGWFGQGSSASSNLDIRAEKGHLTLQSSTGNIYLQSEVIASSKVSGRLSHSNGYMEINSFSSSYGSGQGEIWYRADNRQLTFVSRNSGDSGASDVTVNGHRFSSDAFEVRHNGTGYLQCYSGSEFRVTQFNSGSYYRPIRASSFPTGSSIRYKDNLTKFEYDYAKYLVQDTEVFRYHLKSDLEGRIYDKPKIGVIAEMAPSEIRDQDGVDTYSMVSTLWTVVKEQIGQIEALQNEVALLRNEMYAIDQENDAQFELLKAEVESIKASLAS